MFAQESVMDIQKEKDAYLGELLERDAITQDEYNDIIFRPSVNAFDSNYLSARFIDNINWGWNSWQAAKAQAVPEGFVEKTESNTHHYFKLKDWDEWTCIDGIKDAITSDHDINAIVEVECLEVIEINNKPCFALLAFGKRHGTEVKFFDTEEEAIEAQEPAK